MTKNPLLLVSVSALLALSASGCGNQSTTAPTTTTTSTTSTTSATTTTSSGSTELFTGDLAPTGVGVYSFTVTNAGTVAITLASVTRGGLPAPAAALSLGFGVPSGAGCATTISLSAAAGLSAQIATSALSGIYCVELRDPGTLTAAVSFVVRIVHT